MSNCKSHSSCPVGEPRAIWLYHIPPKGEGGWRDLFPYLWGINNPQARQCILLLPGIYQQSMHSLTPNMTKAFPNGHRPKGSHHNFLDCCVMTLRNLCSLAGWELDQRQDPAGSTEGELQPRRQPAAQAFWAPGALAGLSFYMLSPEWGWFRCVAGGRWGGGGGGGGEELTSETTSLPMNISSNILTAKSNIPAALPSLCWLTNLAFQSDDIKFSASLKWSWSEKTMGPLLGGLIIV